MSHGGMADNDELDSKQKTINLTATHSSCKMTPRANSFILVIFVVL